MTLKHKILFILLSIGLIFALAGWAFSSYKYNKTLKCERQIAEHNYRTFTDSIKVYKNKADELYSTKRAFIFSNKQLKEQNIALSDEVKKYKQELTSALLTTITVQDTFIQTVYLPFISKTHSLQIKDSTLDIRFKAIITDTSAVLSDFDYSLTLPIFVGFAYNKKRNQASVLVRSLPNVTFTNLEAFTIPTTSTPKPKRFGLGIQAGFGLGLTKTQTLDNNILKVGYRPLVTPTISIGIYYSIIQF